LINQFNKSALQLLLFPKN